MQETKSTCPYCGVGCGVIIESEGAQITGVRGDPTHPANFGRLCTKGSTLHLTATSAITQQTRLLQPQPPRRRPSAASLQSLLPARMDRTQRPGALVQCDHPSRACSRRAWA